MKLKVTATLLAFVMLLAILPAKPLYAADPLLFHRVDVTLAEGVSIVLADVYEYYVPFGYRKSIYMGQGGAIRFVGIDGPYHHQFGVLQANRTFTFAELAPEGWGAVSFNLGRCRTTGSYLWADYMGLIGGTYEWVAQIMLNQYMDFEAHTGAMAQYGRNSLLNHVLPGGIVERPHGFAALIPSITIRPTELLPGCTLQITLTNAFDSLERADITFQSQESFFLAPNGSISFNRDIELSSMFEGGARFETVTLAAGEVFYVYGHENLSFQYGSFPVICCHQTGYREHWIGFRVVEEPPYVFQWSAGISGFDINIPRVLRFAIGEEFFTDRGFTRWLEASPFIANERTMVPFRVIGEALGAEIGFCEDTVSVSFVLNGQTLTLPVGVPLPGGMGTPVIVNSRTFVPVRFVSETLGATIRWCDVNYAVYVYI